jgi:predicted dinucleotide-utilizing enzyme
MNLAMTPLRALACAVLCTAALAGLASAGNSHASVDTTHRYLIQRSFPKGALDGLDAVTKAKVNQTNARFGVKWLISYASGDRTKTFCIYEGPTEEAIRQAAQANHLPIDTITEVPVTLDAR